MSHVKFRVPGSTLVGHFYSGPALVGSARTERQRLASVLRGESRDSRAPYDPETLEAWRVLPDGREVRLTPSQVRALAH